MNAEDISRIGVIGAGLMGHGIALNFALGGFDVYLNDTTDESLEKALENVDTSLGTMKSVGLADEASAAAVPSRIHTSTSLAETVADVDFVVEAVFEDMEIKHEVFARLDDLSPPAHHPVEQHLLLHVQPSSPPLRTGPTRSS